jgi:trehalose/maltose hydrolase-like predicted phosphorylase
MGRPGMASSLPGLGRRGIGHVPPFSAEGKKRNFEFYDPLTALLMDLADVGGNVKDGCHIASMGGTWMMLTYGLGGMRDDDGRCHFGHAARQRITPYFGFPSPAAAS